MCYQQKILNLIVAFKQEKGTLNKPEACHLLPICLWHNEEKGGLHSSPLGLNSLLLISCKCHLSGLLISDAGLAGSDAPTHLRRFHLKFVHSNLPPGAGALLSQVSLHNT